MNAMGLAVPTMIGVDQRDVARKISRLVPEYMTMGERGMHDRAEMSMPLPDNTLPMMTGSGPFGPFGPVGMGGMFNVVKVRDDLQRGDFSEPGPYAHPGGTLASEYTAEPEPSIRATGAERDDSTLTVRKPTGHGGH